MAESSAALTGVVAEAMVAFSTDANYFVAMVEQGRVHSLRAATANAVTYVTTTEDVTIVSPSASI